jgi:taurine dioxygenase
MTISVHPLSPALGAEVRGVDLGGDIDDGTFAEIVAAWHAHLVLCFPDQELDEDAQARFCRRFGRLAPRRAASGPSNPHAMIISNIKEDGAWIGALPLGALSFHSDGAYNPNPYKASILYAIEVPARGGETVFANMYAVFEALDDETRALLEGCTADNHFQYDPHTAPGHKKQTDADHYIHPVVITHPATGRRALFVNRRMTRTVVELEPAIYQPVLARIFDMVESADFTYAHRWRPGDLVVWDNRCIQHGRRDFDPGERRLLRRFAIIGDGPPRREVAPDARTAL